MDPQSFIIGLMAGITLFGGGILIAMIVLERPRYGPRCWLGFVSSLSRRLRLWTGSQQKTSREWLQAEADHQRLRETVLDELERRKALKGRRQSPEQKRDPADKP
jgi:hypothetical protein